MSDVAYLIDNDAANRDFQRAHAGDVADLLRDADHATRTYLAKMMAIFQAAGDLCNGIDADDDITAATDHLADLAADTFQCWPEQIARMRRGDA